jgi:hypothetical protein
MRRQERNLVKSRLVVRVFMPVQMRKEEMIESAHREQIQHETARKPHEQRILDYPK